MTLRPFRYIIGSDSTVTLNPHLLSDDNFHPLRAAYPPAFNVIDLTLKQVHIPNIINSVIGPLSFNVAVGMEIHLTLFDCIFPSSRSAYENGGSFRHYPSITKVTWYSHGKPRGTQYKSMLLMRGLRLLNQFPQPWMTLISSASHTITSIHVCGVHALDIDLRDLVIKRQPQNNLRLKELDLEYNDDDTTTHLLNYLRGRYGEHSMRTLQSIRLRSVPGPSTCKALPRLLALCRNLQIFDLRATDENINESAYIMYHLVPAILNYPKTVGHPFFFTTRRNIQEEFSHISVDHQVIWLWGFVDELINLIVDRRNPMRWSVAQSEDVWCLESTLLPKSTWSGRVIISKPTW